MLVTKISDVPQMVDDQQILCIKGKVKSIGKRFEGQGDNGPWSFQDVMIQGPDGQAKVVLVGRPVGDVDKDSIGKTLYFLSEKNSKGAFFGVKAKDHKNKKKNTVERVVWVTGNAVVQETEPVSGDQSASTDDPSAEDDGYLPQTTQAAKPPVQQQQPAKPPVQQQQTQQTQQPAKSDVADANKVILVKKFLARRAHYMLLCLDAANYVANNYEKKFGEPMSEAQFQSITSSFFISGTQVKYPENAICDVLPNNTAE